MWLMSNITIYPFGLSSATPEGVLPVKLAKMQSTIDKLAPLAFRETPNSSNPTYRRVAIFPTSTNNIATLRYGYTSSNNNYLMSPLFELGKNGDTFSIRFSVGEVKTSGQYPGIIYFNEDMEPYSYHLATVDPRVISGTVTSSSHFVRLLFNMEHVFESYIYDVQNGEYLFKGSDIDLTEVMTEEDFRNSPYWLDWGPNSRGDWIGWNFGLTDSAQTAQRDVEDSPIYRPIGTASSPFSFSVSKIIPLPAGYTSLSLEFSVGEVDTNLMLRFLNPVAKTASYYTANANPRTVTVNTASWTHVQLYFRTENYSNCYIKDDTNNVMLWEGSESTE